MLPGLSFFFPGIIFPHINCKLYEMQQAQIEEALRDWRVMIKKYQQPNTKKAIIQLLNSFLPFLGICILMYFSLGWSYFITLFLALVNAFFLVRIFIIQHDCGHQSFLNSKKWNNVIGFVSSLFSTIPYKYWSRTHNAHHTHSGQLEYRGLGDIYYLTTEEYRHSSFWGKLGYRIYRNPIVQFIVAPIIYILFSLRYPFIRLKGWKRIRVSYFMNNILLVLAYIAIAFIVGWQNFLLVQVPIIFFFGIIAFWFFYVQHQHEDNYKERKEQWNHLLASIKGATYYKLPKLFQWLSGNIGFHHIHHLNPRIPNYHLEACAKENPVLNKFVNVLTFKQSLKCMNYKLWDHKQKRMITFKEYAAMA